MFEHFGLKDVFVGIWKYKWKILISSIFLTIFVSTLVHFYPVEVEQLNIETGNSTELQCARIDFYLDYTGTDTQLSSKVLSGIYKDTITGTACQKYTSDKIVREYGKPAIVDIFDNTITEEQITSKSFTQFVTVGIKEDEVGMYLLVRTPDMQFSKDILAIYMEWIRDVAGAENSKVDVVVVSESEEIVSINTEQTQSLAERQQWSVKKIAIVAFVCFLLLSCVIVFAICLFKPTINRKSDFTELGLDVLAEIWIDKKGGRQ